MEKIEVYEESALHCTAAASDLLNQTNRMISINELTRSTRYPDSKGPKEVKSIEQCLLGRL